MRHRTFYLLFALCVMVDAAKLAATFAMGPAPLQNDAAGYWILGGQLAGGDFLLVETAGTGRTPGYPAFLAPFQRWFGQYALMAAIAGQHVLVMATSLITAWICGRISGSRVGFLLGYLAMLLGTARAIYANAILSETLYALLLAIGLAAILAYNMQPTLAKAVTVGGMLGLTIMVRPVSQALWLPVVAVMLMQPWWTVGPTRLRHALGHGLVLVIAMTVVIAPWYARNYTLYGEPFMTKFVGRNMWLSAFHSCGARLDVPDSAAAGRLKSLIARVNHNDAVNWEQTWSVSSALGRASLSEPEVDDLMLRVSLDAVRAQPWRFARSFVFRNGLYWACVPDKVESFSLPGQQQTAAADYRGQHTWHSGRWGGGYARVLQSTRIRPPRYHGLLTLAISFWCFVGGMVLALRRKSRAVGMTLLLTLTYFGVLTSFVECIGYRYRLIVEPAMMTAGVCGALLAWRMLRVRLRRHQLKAAVS